MIVCGLDSEAWTVGGAIKMAPPVIQTNNNVELKEDGTGLIFKTPGWYRVRFQAVATASDVTLGMEFKANGTVINLTDVTISATNGDDYSLNREYPIQIKPSEEAGEYALLEFVATTTASGASGLVFVDKME